MLNVEKVSKVPDVTVQELGEYTQKVVDVMEHMKVEDVFSFSTNEPLLNGERPPALGSAWTARKRFPTKRFSIFSRTNKVYVRRER